MTSANESNKERVKSPCTRHCCLDDNDVCLGCCRTLDEILNWAASTSEQKKELKRICEQRKKKLTKHKWQGR